LRILMVYLLISFEFHTTFLNFKIYTPDITLVLKRSKSLYFFLSAVAYFACVTEMLKCWISRFLPLASNCLLFICAYSFSFKYSHSNQKLGKWLSSRLDAPTGWMLTKWPTLVAHMWCGSHVHISTTSWNKYKTWE